MTLVSLAMANSMADQTLPVDVSDVEDLTESSSYLRVAANEFGLNTRLAQVGTHGEIGDCGDHRDPSGDVVEDTVRTRFGERHAYER